MQGSAAPDSRDATSDATSLEKAPADALSLRLMTPRRRSPGRAAAYGAGRGFVAGVGATLVMSAVMLAAQKAGLMGQLPPQKISDRMLRLVGLRHKTPRPARRAIAAVSHFAFGGASGALFGVAHEVWRNREGNAVLARERRAPVLAGVVFASAVWATSYFGWVPAARIMPRPQEDRPGRPTSMVVAHWVFGAVLAELVA